MAAPPATQSSLIAALTAAAKPLDTRAILQQAHAQALANTNSIVAGIQGQQQAAEQQAAQRARDVQAAGNAGGSYLTSLDLGGKLAAAYRQAGQDQAGLASGFSGGLQRTVGDEAAQQNQILQKLGGAGGVPQNAQAAGNTVYAVGGAIPAAGFAASAPLAVQDAQLAARGLAGNAQQDALATIGAGGKAAAALQPQIAAAQAKTPTLEQDYITRLTTAAEKAHQDAIGNVFKALAYQQKGDQQAALDSYRQAQVSATRAANLERAAHDRATESVATENADTSRYKATKPTAPTIIGTDATGRYTYDSAKGTLTPLPGRLGKPAATSASTSGKLTTGQRVKYISEINDTVGFLRSGVPDTTNAAGKTVAGKPALNFQDALEFMGEHGYFATPELRKLSLVALRRAYPAAEIAIAAGQASGPPIPSASAPPKGP